jgi:hypothetical protein
MRQVWRQLPLLNAQATKVIVGCKTNGHVTLWRCAAAHILLHKMHDTAECRLYPELQVLAPPRKEALAKWPPRRKLAVGDDPMYGLLYPACAPDSNPLSAMMHLLTMHLSSCALHKLPASHKPGT